MLRVFLDAALCNSAVGKSTKAQSDPCSDATQTGGKQCGWSPWDIWATIFLFFHRHSRKVQPGGDSPCAEQSLALAPGGCDAGLMMLVRFLPPGRRVYHQFAYQVQLVKVIAIAAGRPPYGSCPQPWDANSPLCGRRWSRLWSQSNAALRFISTWEERHGRRQTDLSYLQV